MRSGADVHNSSSRRILLLERVDVIHHNCGHLRNQEQSPDFGVSASDANCCQDDDEERQQGTGDSHSDRSLATAVTEQGKKMQIGLNI